MELLSNARGYVNNNTGLLNTNIIKNSLLTWWQKQIWTCRWIRSVSSDNLPAYQLVSKYICEQLIYSSCQMLKLYFEILYHKNMWQLVSAVNRLTSLIKCSLQNISNFNQLIKLCFLTHKQVIFPLLYPCFKEGVYCFTHVHPSVCNKISVTVF